MALLANRIDGVRQSQLYRVRTNRTFREAARKYLEMNKQKKSISDDENHLTKLDLFIGEVFLSSVYMEVLGPFIEKRKDDGVKSKTINLALEIVRRILRLAAYEWRDEQGLTWLQVAPKIKLLRVTDARKPYPLSAKEQELLFCQLPGHLRRMALYKVNTGSRQEEVCSLRWEWEKQIPEFGTSVFVIPGEKVKNSEDRLAVLNRVAMSAINEARGIHAVFVFVREKENCRYVPIAKMNNTAWRNARTRAAGVWELAHGASAPEGFRRVRVHDLKHTFGRRLRAAGVSFEDRQDLLGHKSQRITTHYSNPELSNLIAAAEKACG